MQDQPCMIARFGAFELSTLVNYLGVKGGKNNYVSYIKGNELDWWWNRSIINYMHTNAGFFPPTIPKIEDFSKLMLTDIDELDILGSWLAIENTILNKIDAIKVKRTLMDPFWTNQPWTKALSGKKVLVVHPFSKTIKHQYEKRKKLFVNDILPDFELITITAVQSIAGANTSFVDWFEALEYMKSEINKQDYDICLIGAGAYGFHLAAHVKRMGKKGVHIGGSLQLFFGIIGNRWEKKGYNDEYDYPGLINSSWVRPDADEKITSFTNVEGGCYW
jgi:hypothetical protein